MRVRTLGVAVPAAIGFALFSGAPAWGGGGCFGALSEGTGVTVELSQICFNPTVLRVQPGETVTWVNRDGVNHLVTGAAGSFGSGQLLGAGQSIRHQFTTAGVFPYTCSLHHGMSGVVIVGDGATSAVRDVQANPAAAPVKPASDSGAWPAVALGLAAMAGAAGYLAGRLRRGTRGTQAARGTAGPA